jgi:hypothetical protein
MILVTGLIEIDPSCVKTELCILCPHQLIEPTEQMNQKAVSSVYWQNNQTKRKCWDAVCMLSIPDAIEVYRG